MAESSSEKTEQPTPKRLRDAREKGDIAKSQEVVSVCGVLVLFAYLLAMSPDLFANLMQLVDVTIEKATTLSYEEAKRELLPLFITELIRFIAPLLVCLVFFTLLGFLIQNGFIFAPKAAQPKLENLNPQQWFKKVFSKKNLFELVKNIIKIVLLTLAVFMALKNSLREILAISDFTALNIAKLCGYLVKELFIFTLIAFIVIAVFDFLYSKHSYIKKHMMSRDEVKREFKEQDGDPIIKSKRRQLHQEMINQGKLDQVRKAKVLIVNPTHFAVAIDYDKEKAPLPYMLAKGEGSLALAMIEVAKQENIPIMRNPPLARALYKDGFENEFIPQDLLIQVAEVLKVVMSLEQNN